MLHIRKAFILATGMSALLTACGNLDRSEIASRAFTNPSSSSGSNSALGPTNLETLASQLNVSGLNTSNALQYQTDLNATLDASLLNTAKSGSSSKEVSFKSIALPPASVQSPNCVTRSVAFLPGRPDLRPNFVMPQMLELEPGSTVVSPCLKLTGLAEGMSIRSGDKTSISVNGSAFFAGAVQVKDNDEIRFKSVAPLTADAKNEDPIIFSDGIDWGRAVMRTKNADRAPQVFQVGANRAYRQIKDVAGLLRAGDSVEVDPGVYEPVEFKRAGTVALPITIKGVGGSRPIISGGDRAVSFNGSHNIVFENFEVTGAATICVRHQANNLVLRDVFIHDCPKMGILGADLGNGMNVLDRVEIARTGAVLPGEPGHHAIYIATDRDAFPDSVLRIQNSYFHDNKGTTIRSRASRTEIYFNWIDVPSNPQSYYAMELIGYDGYQVEKPLNSDVTGNVIVLRGKFGTRFGGDGVGSSKGRVRMANNTIMISDNFGGNDPVMRLTFGFDSLYLLNNAFVREGGKALETRMFYIDVNEWVGGALKIAGTNNLFPVKASWNRQQMKLLNSTLHANGTEVGGISELDTVVRVGPGLAIAAAPLDTVAAGYEIPDPLLAIKDVALPSRRGRPLVFDEKNRRDRPSNIVGAKIE
jgi:hypothetical protein